MPGIVVLGSASPRRREILDSLGVAHVVQVASVDESVRADEAASAYLARVVSDKLDAVQRALSPENASRASAILVADTSVILGSVILGKPGGPDEAFSMIVQLAGKTHEVHTRFALAGIKSDFIHEETVVTRVTFRSLDERRARQYAASGEGMDKAGGYAAQGLAGAFVSRIDGSYSCVVGLPACEVAVALELHGLR